MSTDYVQRITPADAGKTRNTFARCAGGKDHPRGCGENGYFFPHLAVIMGSPPRMRGKLDRCMGAAAARRITPADAGKTRELRAVAAILEDHPRGCGENLSTEGM